MNILTIIATGVLVILIFVQMHNSMRIEERRQELEELMDKSNHVITKFDSVFKDMEGTNRSYAAVINRISELRKENDSLSEKNQSLLRQNENLEWCNDTLKSVNQRLTKQNNELNEKQSHYKQALKNYQNESNSLIDSIEKLKSTKQGFEIALNNIPAVEIDILSELVWSLGLKKQLTEKLISNGIACIGELVRHSKESLIYSTGIRDASFEKIDSALSANNLHLGMNVAWVDGAWYLIQSEKPVE